MAGSKIESLRTKGYCCRWVVSIIVGRTFVVEGNSVELAVFVVLEETGSGEEGTELNGVEVTP